MYFRTKIAIFVNFGRPLWIKNFAIIRGHLVILRPFGALWPFWYYLACCAKKNLATPVNNVGDDVPHYVRTSLMYKWSKSQ
jgi:hypothetical protein